MFIECLKCAPSFITFMVYCHRFSYRDVGATELWPNRYMNTMSLLVLILLHDIWTRPRQWFKWNVNWLFWLIELIYIKSIEIYNQIYQCKLESNLTKSNRNWISLLPGPVLETFEWNILYLPFALLIGHNETVVVIFLRDSTCISLKCNMDARAQSYVFSIAHQRERL